jgi:MYXO-CTERM domain-containing protein
VVAALLPGLLRSLALSATLSALLLTSAREASACTPPPSGWFPSGTFPAPANGVVLLRYACYVDCETAPAVENLLLKNAAGAPVPGRVVFSQLRAGEVLVAFLPEPAAVTAGSVYTAELEGLPPTSGILIGPSVTWNDAQTLADETFESQRPAGDAVCCSGPVDSCGQVPCFRRQVERRTAVAVGWGDPQAIERYQYAFRIGRESIDPATPWSWEGGDAWFELDLTEDSACYVLELKRLADDSVQTFASRCVEQPESFMPGVHSTSAADIAAVLQSCDEPPDGYEDAWCEARADLCELSPDEVWCPDVAARCTTVGAAGAAGSSSVAGAPGDGGKASNGGKTGNGGRTSAAGGMGGTAGSSGAQGGTAGRAATGGTGGVQPGGGMSGAGTPNAEAGEASDSNDPQRIRTKGCGCSVPGNGSGEHAASVLALALVALRLRRTRYAGRPPVRSE